MAKLSARHAAIAQPVERILGKDEVASSNLASSSIKKPEIPMGFRLSSFLRYMLTAPKTDTETDTGIFYLIKFYVNFSQKDINTSHPHCAECVRARGNYPS